MPLEKPAIQCNAPGGSEQWLAYYDALKKASPEELKATWEEISTEEYWYLMECLPPIRMKDNAFMVGECMTHGNHGTIYEAVITVGECHYARPAYLQEFSPEEFTAEIVDLFYKI